MCCRKPRVTVCQAGCRGSRDGGPLGWFCLPPGNGRFGGSVRLSGAAACLSESTSSCSENGPLCSLPKAPASRPPSKGHPVVPLDVPASYTRASGGQLALRAGSVPHRQGSIWPSPNREVPADGSLPVSSKSRLSDDSGPKEPVEIRARYRFRQCICANEGVSSCSVFGADNLKP